MNDKQIKKLALASYKNKILDELIVNKIANKLSKTQLKTYIRYIKSIEKINTVYVYVPKITSSQNLKEFSKMFEGKKVLVLEDKSLVAGIKIVNNDLIYEENLKNNLDNLIGFVGV